MHPKAASPIDRASDLLGTLAAWMFFAVGAMITYEVVARYVFRSPTIWAEEMSRFFQIWATYLAAGYVLRHRELITIEVLTIHLAPPMRRLTETGALAVIMLFCTVAVYYGADTMLESIRLGRATATMLTVPLWMTELAIPFGFGVLLLQAFVELVRVWRAGALSDRREPPG